jgi:Spy/CpxP family protein refolding chaperone
MQAILTGQMTLGKPLKLKTIAAASMLLFLCVSFAYAQASTEQSKEEKARKRELKRDAALNLWRLKKSIEEEGFYAARVALNIWRSTAIDAGTFDQAKYDELKKQMYEKSVEKSLLCFEYYLEETSFHDAFMCLQTWKIHSQEIGVFDAEKYQALKDKLEDARAQKAEAEKKQSEDKEK